MADDTTEDLPGSVSETAEAVSGRDGNGITVRWDPTDDGGVEALFDRVEAEQGRLDILVNDVWGGYEGYDETFGDPFWAQPVDRWPRSSRRSRNRCRRRV